MVPRKGGINSSCANALFQRKQFSETNETLHAFQQISDLKIFPECFHGSLKMLWRVTCGLRAYKWTPLT